MKVRPGCQKYCILRCLGRPESAKKAKIFIVAGAPIRKKSDVRSRYVCVFVHVLMAKTTIGKSMCVFVSIRVFVCLFVLAMAKTRRLRLQRDGEDATAKLRPPLVTTVSPLVFAVALTEADSG